ncbi:alpha/beta fold hydrolase [Actinomycetospora sp. OC33-EN08]|uniref:Alpha/beta fold hydrolase n=1 Tax=Actinomycetospora aurantiaca TaxID=3129233 RepID=A0ABU8MT02_9PSEU
MPGPKEALAGALGAARQVEALGRNAAEYVWFGGLRVDPETSPYEVRFATPTFRLRHYFPQAAPEGLPALLLVPPLMMMTEVYDTAPRSSSVRAVHEAGVDVWVVDFGRPEAEPGGLERDVADHVIAVSDAVAAVVTETGRDVVLGGYSQGGMFCYEAAAYRRGDGIDSVIAFGSPVDFGAAPLPIPLSFDSYASIARGLLQTGLADRLSLPGWFNRSATRLLEPLKALQFELAYVRQLHDRERLLPGEQQRRFLAHDGWTHYAGPSFRDLLENVLVTNRLRDGGLLIEDRTVSLADLTLPMLLVIGDIDREGHPGRSARWWPPPPAPTSTSWSCTPDTSASSRAAARGGGPGRASRSGSGGGPARPRCRR